MAKSEPKTNGQGRTTATEYRRPPSDVRLATRLREFARDRLSDFPWSIEVTDWNGDAYQVGRNETHWYRGALQVHLKTPAAGKTLISGNSMAFLEMFLAGSVMLSGNLYLLTQIKQHADFSLKPLQALYYVVRYGVFQNESRARVNVKSHYDVSQEALNVYLDKRYMSYSCAIFENPERLEPDQFLRVGQGEGDSFDSLEKAQWRKFKDAVDYIAPREGETLLDVGCGYGGQLAVALEQHPFGKVVGWTHSANQVRDGLKMLAAFPAERWELSEGDYREDCRVFDHVTSTGMVSHVGPRGLVPYVKNIRKRIRKGGRYVHHGLMFSYSPLPHDSDVALVFNKRYVWPGFHWFTVGTHVKALEENGFQIKKMLNLSNHYAKTTASWYERMMDQRELMTEKMGEETFRAWQIFLAGVTEGFHTKTVHVFRIYAEAV